MHEGFPHTLNQMIGSYHYEEGEYFVQVRILGDTWSLTAPDDYEIFLEDLVDVMEGKWEESIFINAVISEEQKKNLKNGSQ